MKVTIIGTGFVGVVSASVYASFGNEVYGLDIDQKKVEMLQNSKVPFFEPQLEDLLVKTQKEGQLKFTTDYKTAVTDSDVIIVAVGTPSTPEGGADLKFVFSACDSMAQYLEDGAVVVIKSTVPPGTLDIVRARIAEKTTVKFSVASVPEFLKEGTAVDDTLHPDRIVVGVEDDHSFEVLSLLHAPLNAPIVKVAPASAQMAKYAANSYLATRITFINQIADLCEKNGADIQEVINAIGFDKRIGAHYWYPGFGYGGSCFPKDVKELAHYSKNVGEDNNIFVKLDELNEKRIPKLMNRYASIIDGFAGKKVAVLGLSFKPNTDDMREAPSIKVIDYLLQNGAKVVGFDPKALEVTKYFIKDHANLSYVDNIEQACEDADVIMCLIEWKEIINFDFAKVKNNKKQYFIDARNQFNRSKLINNGYEYIGVGR